jgi:hypothetical protein
MAKRREIRNSTAEFLIFQVEGKEQGVEVFYKDKTVWCTQKAMGMLFDCTPDNVGLHLKNIFKSGELIKESVTEKISATASDGKNYMTQFYNLDAIISVGYRVNSIRATQFRQWATSVLREYAIFFLFFYFPSENVNKSFVFCSNSINFAGQYGKSVHKNRAVARTRGNGTAQ